jgi:ATP-dependent Lon protease
MARPHSRAQTGESADKAAVALDETGEAEQTDHHAEGQEGKGNALLPALSLGAEIQFANENGEHRWIKRIFDPGAAVAEACDDENDDRFGDGKQQVRLKALVEMAKDPMKGWRPMIAADQAMISALEDLAAGAPNFSALFDVVLAAARASLHAAMPIQLHPLLLVGPPGAGKSRAASAIAAVLETSVEKVPVTMQSGAGVLNGLDVSWRNPRLGVVARALLSASTASPVLVLDEIDKSNPRSEYGQLLDPLHDLLEVDTARAFRDEYLQMPLAADAVIWLATANEKRAIPEPILDRMLVIEISQPTEDEMDVILVAMARAAMARWGDWFAADDGVTPATLLALRIIHPRAARRVIDLAVGFAVAAGRRKLLIQDIEHARRVVDAPSRGTKIGFV